MPSDDADRVARLSKRELQIARAYAAGNDYREIADRLFIAPTTVRTHLRRIYRKLEVSSKISLLRLLGSMGTEQEIAGSPPDTSGAGSSERRHDGDHASGTSASTDRQEIRYCRASDGVRLAYAISGHGPPLVKTANWINHLEYDWESPLVHHLVAGLSRDHTLLRYDARGAGLSDWDVANLSLDAWVGDLGVVADAAGFERFPLLGISQGCAVSIAFAVQHPERVSHLILYGGFARGASKRSPQEAAKAQALATLTRLQWNSESPAVRQMFTAELMPDCTKEQMDMFTEMQRRATSAESATRYMEAVAEFDITDLLPKLKVQTLVVHTRGDARIPFELGRELAAVIPGAKFVALQGKNHWLLENDPATRRLLEEINLFLAGTSR